MRFEGGVPIVTQEPKGRIGSAFDDFLTDEGIFEEVQAGALKKVAAHQAGEALKGQKQTVVARAIDILTD